MIIGYARWLIYQLNESLFFARKQDFFSAVFDWVLRLLVTTELISSLRPSRSQYMYVHGFRGFSLFMVESDLRF